MACRFHTVVPILYFLGCMADCWRYSHIPAHWYEKNPALSGYAHRPLETHAEWTLLQIHCPRCQTDTILWNPLSDVSKLGKLHMQVWNIHRFFKFVLYLRHIILPSVLCGNVVIPFDNTIEKGTDLYNLYNTNIHEKIAMEKEKDADW